jgi:hypothetical protein
VVRFVSRRLQVLRHHVAGPVLAIVLSAAGSSAPGAQQLIITADASRVPVGEQVTVRVEARMSATARPIDRMPRLVDTLPDGVRVVSQDSLTPVGDGAYVARMRFAFFRPGVASVPALALAFRTSENLPPDTFYSRPLPIEVVASLPPGYQPMRDIKELQPLSTNSRDVRWLVILAVAALGVVLYLASIRRGRRLALHSVMNAASLERSPATASGPYGKALALLREIEEAHWPSTGQVARHYERVTDVLRSYLEDEHHVRATDRTTSELVWSLPAALSADGQREECHALLKEADLVKFARFQPDENTATAFLGSVRALLSRWHSVTVSAPDSATSISATP